MNGDAGEGKMHRRMIALAMIASLCLPLEVAAQIGTPGNGPLVPGGPRQGLGPPSITDSVPDIRLRQDGGGIPGAGPPVDGRPGVAPSYGQAAPGARNLYRARRVLARQCVTPRSTCRLARPVAIGDDCSCRGRGRAALRGYGVP